MPPSDEDRRPQDREAAAAKTGERRSETRHPSDQPAVVKLLNPLQTSGWISASVIEISRGGLRLRTDRALMPGTLVQIRVGGKLVMGEIRYCNPAGEEYHAGVRLQDVFETGAGS